MMGLGVFEILLVLLIVAVPIAVVIVAVTRSRQTPIMPTATLSPHELEGHVRDLVGQNHKIHAVKLVRDQTGLNLKDAVAMVDRIAAGQPAISPHARPQPRYDQPDLATRVRDLKAAGRAEQAVHLVRGETGMGQSEAELFVEGL